MDCIPTPEQGTEKGVERKHRKGETRRETDYPQRTRNGDATFFTPARTACSEPPASALRAGLGRCMYAVGQSSQSPQGFNHSSPVRSFRPYNRATTGRRRRRRRRNIRTCRRKRRGEEREGGKGRSPRAGKTENKEKRSSSSRREQLKRFSRGQWDGMPERRV